MGQIAEAGLDQSPQRETSRPAAAPKFELMALRIRHCSSIAAASRDVSRSCSRLAEEQASRWALCSWKMSYKVSKIQSRSEL